MTKQDQIIHLEKAIKSSVTPETLKEKMRVKLAELKGEEIKQKSPSFKKGDFVAHKTHKSIGEVLEVFDKGELRTDADGVVSIDELEKYSKIKHKDYKTAPSTQKNIDKKKQPLKTTSATSVKKAAKKYYGNREIKSITVMENGKKVTYSGKDVFNGANFLEKGGKLSERARYITKSNVVFVEFQDGTEDKPSNGYHIKKGATPILENGGEVSNKIKLVVVNNHTLGYILPENPKTLNILHTSVLKGSSWNDFSNPSLGRTSEVRLANEKDFDEFRVRFEGYESKEYLKGSEELIYDNGIWKLESEKHDKDETIGFIPMTLEHRLSYVSKWGGLKSIREAIFFLSAMIDAGITKEDLNYTESKTSISKREKQKDDKIKEIWSKSEPFYKGDLKGNHYYSTISYIISNPDILEEFRPYRKYQKFEHGGQVELPEGSLIHYQNYYLEKGGKTNSSEVIELKPLELESLSSQLNKYTGKQYTSDFVDEKGNDRLPKPGEILVHKTSGMKFLMPEKIYNHIDGYNLIIDEANSEIVVFENGKTIAEIVDGKLDFTFKDPDISINKPKVIAEYDKKNIPFLVIKKDYDNFDLKGFLNYVYPKAKELLKQYKLNLDKDFTITKGKQSFLAEPMYSSIDGEASKVVIAYYDDEMEMVGTIEFNLFENELHFQFEDWDIDEVDMYKLGGALKSAWKRERKYVNNSQDYEKRYAVGKKRGGYKSKFEKGGVLTKDERQEYSELIEKYDLKGALLEDAIEENDKKLVSKLKSDMDAIEAKIHEFERGVDEKYLKGGPIDKPTIKWEKHPDGHEYTSYKFGTINKSKSGNYSITYFGSIGNVSENAKTLSDAKNRLDKISKEKTDKQNGKIKREGSPVFEKAKEIREEGEKWTDAVKRASLLLKK